MIESTVNGNLVLRALAGYYFAIAHGANCQNTMKSGIAPVICQSFPSALEADQATKKGDRGKLGYYSEGYDDKLDLRIFNLYTQFDFTGRRKGKRDLDYEAVGTGFHWLDQHFAGEARARGKMLGIPMIGCGLAGGDWDAVKEIINLTTPNLPIEVVFLQ